MKRKSIQVTEKIHDKLKYESWRKKKTIAQVLEELLIKEDPQCFQNK